MLGLLGILLIFVAINGLILLGMNYSALREYRHIARVELPLWGTNDTALLIILSVIIFIFILLFQYSNNKLLYIDANNLTSGEYNIASIAINNEQYYLIENSREKVFLLENGTWLQWEKHKECALTIEREESSVEPYVEIGVEKTGNFWKDRRALGIGYKISSIKVHLSENSQIFNYSGIEHKTTIIYK